MAGGSRAEREVQVRDSAQRAAAVVMPIDFRTMRDTSDGGATILLGNGCPDRAVSQSRGSIRSMSASPVGTSGSLSHSETITVVFTAKRVLATQGPHATGRIYRGRGDALSLDRRGQTARACRLAGSHEGEALGAELLSLSQIGEVPGAVDGRFRLIHNGVRGQDDGTNNRLAGAVGELPVARMRGQQDQGNGRRGCG